MDDQYIKILRHNWGYSDFRGIQRDIIESIGQGHDTLGLMPTGGGKSITFQVPALAMEGMCLVITPLIALMKDQVANLRRRGISAASIHAGMSYDEVLTTLENCVFGAVKLLYVSPERLSSDLFVTKLRHTKVSFITVDEAHCISQWGYDFRPSYLKIADIRAVLPNAPVLALTATATPQVVDDIQLRLGFKRPCVFRMSFERTNLAYVVRFTDDKRGEMGHILQRVPGSAIVYVRSRKRTKELAEYLTSIGESATYFHAGLEQGTKDRRQREWTEGRVRVIVATNAFGMGIDKPDVRVVIHTDCPDSMEAYFQEAGRAGRDGQKSYAVLLYNHSDRGKLHKRIDDTFPSKDEIREVYAHVAYYYQVAEGGGNGIPFEFNIDHFCQTFHHFPIRVNSALHILDRAGYIEYDENREWSPRVMFRLSRDELYLLRSLSPLEESVVEALLRTYGGLFVNLSPIDEGTVATKVGRTEPEIHQVLKDLSHRRIIHFVPRTNTPLIRYTQPREDPARLMITREVYEDRRQQYIMRIEAMLSYAASNGVCRSKMLLKYFGEGKSRDCGQCDVCLRHRHQLPSPEALAEAEGMIASMVADGKRHHITELHSIKVPPEVLDEALRHMLHEEALVQMDGFLTKK